ncbi:hypothetical protein R3P38DRAFT_3229228 [Favolaschia claudopus]|uniref:Uncharacterized protein n=1 Tax=Favolaschia claudopus TaxID=2862362 RepID=A0AAV9ZQA2_9AGAR
MPPHKACNKFLVKTPEIMAAQAKKNASKKTTKRKRKDSNDKFPTRTSLLRPRSHTTSTSQSPPPPPTKKRAAKANDDDTLQKGPIIPPVTAPYDELLAAIASELPCLVQNINQSKILWKTKKPASGEKSPLGKAIGYEAMVDDVKKKASRVVVLYMPPPTKPMDDPTPTPTFDYSELKHAGPSDSVMEQKISFNNATRAERAKLEETYPIGNDPRWPTLRIYQQPLTGFCFDLNKTRLDSQNLTDHKTAPASRFFDAQQRIKNISSAPATLNNTAAAVENAAPPAPAITAAPPAATPTPALSITDIFLASLMSNGGIPSLFPRLLTAHPAPLPAANTVITPPAPAPTRSAPPSRQNDGEI